MASIHDKLERVRKPRVHITYQVETEGAQVERELPFVVGVLGDFSGDPTEPLKPLKERKFIQIDRDNFNDVMARLTPGLNLTRQSFTGASQIAIRGISSNAGSGTTGLYIDDTPIQVRNMGFGAGNAFPGLFDIERVEVLRGPQGTLFGAGSEGGTVRFITTEPGLDGPSSTARAGGSSSRLVTRRPVSISPPRLRKSDAIASAILWEPPRARGHPWEWPRMLNM